MSSKQSLIDFRILQAVAAFASTEETRYYLNGVCVEIEPRAAVYVATDGHRLMAYRVAVKDGAPDNELLGQWIIPLAACKATKFKRSFTLGYLVKNESGFALKFGDGVTQFTPIDGKFPYWRRIYPTKPASGKPGHFNWQLLASFDKFAQAIDVPKPHLVYDGEMTPTRVIFSHEPIAAVIMPMRVGGQDAVQKWVNQAPAAAVETTDELQVAE